MEEGCFSSTRSKRGMQSNPQSQKISNGLMYPVYIITSSFNSSCLSQLQKLLDQQRITLTFQNSTDRLRKIPNTHDKRFFVILNDFRQTPKLDGQFLKLSCEIAEYPRQSLEEILYYYNLFVQKEKAASIQSSVINGLIFLSNMSQKQQIIYSTDTESSAKIQMRGISKIVHNYKSSFPKKLFIYSNPNDQEFYLECLKAIDQYQVQNSLYITRIEQYLQFLPEKQDVRFFVIMSQYSATNLRKFFKKSDNIVVCTKTPENCFSLLRGKVTQIICDIKVLNNLITKNFSCRLKEGPFKKNSQLKSCSEGFFPAYAQNSNIQICNGNQIPRSSVLASSIRSGQNLKISQQFSLINAAKKQLNIQSSIIGLKITPQVSSIQQNQKTKQDKLIVNFISPIKISHEQIISSPFKIVQLEHIDLATCDNMELMSNVSGSNIFSEMQNTLDPVVQYQSKIFQNRNEKPAYMSYASSGVQNLISSCINHSQIKSQTSRASQRSSRNSRIIQRYRKELCLICILLLFFEFNCFQSKNIIKFMNNYILKTDGRRHMLKELIQQEEKAIEAKKNQIAQWQKRLQQITKELEKKTKPT